MKHDTRQQGLGHSIDCHLAVPRRRARPMESCFFLFESLLLSEIKMVRDDLEISTEMVGDFKGENWRCSSEVEHLPSTWEALGSILRHTHTQGKLSKPNLDLDHSEWTS
jgi:hypothetical protein